MQKKVRILSPVVSPDTPATYQEHDPFNSYLNPVGQPVSRPTEDQGIDVARELRRSFIDSVAKGTSSLNREVLGAGAPAAQASAPATAAPPAPAPAPVAVAVTVPEKMEAPAQSGQQAPYNPFAKTLATLEPQSAPSPPVGLSRDDTAPAKPAMDVDTFTRMLLTGNSASSSPAPMTPSNGPTATESSSLGDLHPESPSASDDEHDDVHADHEYEQYSGLVAAPEPLPKKPKPPPPAHHHGKALPRKGPQTVSFADFDSPDFSTPALPSPSSPKPQLLRSPSNLNKPLPPPPPPQSTSPEQSTPTPDQSDGPAQSPQPSDNAFQQLQSKKPPPPPLSRRSSQLRSASGRPRSGSNLSRSSVPDDYTETTTAPTTKPPPPPTRRAPHSGSVADRAPEADNMAAAPRVPPPPPSRKQRPPSVSRTPSSQSVASLNQRRVSPVTTQMPPPPPPRRSDAKRQSLDGTFLGPSGSGARRLSDTSRRSSGASFHSAGGRTPSVTSIPTVDEGDSGDDRASTATPQPQVTAEPATQTAGGTDILADMSAMQREIDALMAKSKGGS